MFAEALALLVADADSAVTQHRWSREAKLVVHGDIQQQNSYCGKVLIADSFLLPASSAIGWKNTPRNVSLSFGK